MVAVAAVTPYALTVELCGRVANFEAKGHLAGPLEMRELVDQAGHYLVGMAPWRWLEGRQVKLRSRLPVTLTAATWNEATKTLTQAGAFAANTWLEADTVSITEGTGATVGTYEIASQPNANSIVLATSIGAAANGQTNIKGELQNDQVQLPLDFDLQRITAWGVVDALRNAFNMTSAQTLLDLRIFGGVFTVSFWSLLNYVRTSADGRTIPRIDMNPARLTGEEQFVIFYRGGWATPDDDSSPLPLPKSGWLNALFLEVVKAFALGQEESQNGSLMQRLALVKAGPLFADALGRDQSGQMQIGSMGRGGWIEPRRWTNWFDRASHLGTSQ